MNRTFKAVKLVVFTWMAGFLTLSLIFIYEPLRVIPIIGNSLDAIVTVPFSRLAERVLIHLFGVAGVAITQHPTDSRDTALNWAAVFVIAIASLVASIALVAILRTRQQWAKQAIWFRYITRMMLIVIMIRYGIFKVFPLQMSPPSLAILNEPVGQSSPMSLLWTLIGMSPAYQMSSGALELACALLLMFRRTALLGSILGIIVMGHVLLLNLCFDVPVKLGAILIFFGFTALMAPDVDRLTALFWRHQPVQLNSPWRPETASKALTRTVMGIEITYIACALIALVPVSIAAQRQELSNIANASPLVGGWRLDSASTIVSGRKVDTNVLTGELIPMIALYIEPDGRAMAKAADGRLWRAQALVDSASHTMNLGSGYFDGERFGGQFAYTLTDNTHLELEPKGSDSARSPVLRLTRIPLATDYPLLERKFQWVQEWATER